ncbi:MAG: DUF5067 domain-containing protein [Clostridiales bacterium]|nr:DUF5067 domain-containing protein [Clostridiales bacterium]
MSDKLIKCKACGADMAKSAKVCPSCGAKNKKHTALWIILIVIGVIAIASAIGGGSKPKLAEDNAGSNQSQESGNTTQGTATQEKTKFGVGERVDLNDIIVTLVGVSENNGSDYMTPSDGKVFVICEFEIENNSSKDIAVSSVMSFEAYIDDYSTQTNITSMLSTDKSQLDGTVAAGKKMNGVIGYEASPDWKNIEIKFTPDFWSGKDITFVYDK